MKTILVFLTITSLLASSQLTGKSMGLQHGNEKADIAIPGRPTKVSTLFGTITIKCQGDGKCGYIKVDQNKAFFDLGNGVEEIRFLDYKISKSPSSEGSESIITVVLRTE